VLLVLMAMNLFNMYILMMHVVVSGATGRAWQG
jgi:hypothetical protein